MANENPIKLLEHIKTSEIKSGDILVFEGALVSPNVENIQNLLESLQKQLPENVSFVVVNKGDFLSHKTEKSMNDLGWFGIESLIKHEKFSDVLNKVEFNQPQELAFAA